MTTRVHLPYSLIVFHGTLWDTMSHGWQFSNRETSDWLEAHVGMMWSGIFVEQRIFSKDFRILLPELYETTRPYLLFIKPEDALLFKLTWC